MAHWGKCKYIMMVKMKSGYRGGENKRLERVVGAVSKRILSAMFAVGSLDFILKATGEPLKNFKQGRNTIKISF